MPTQAKVDRVSELKEKLERCSIAVTTNYTNIKVNEMTELRRRTRDAGLELLVIKNTLMSLAADAAQRPQFKEIMQGPTAVAFGYDDPISVAKALHDYIRTTRSALTIQGAVMGDGPALRSSEVERLATLPPKDQLVGQLLSQLQSPVYRLLNVLNGPLWSLGGLLQARIQQMESIGDAVASSSQTEGSASSADEGEPEAVAPASSDEEVAEETESLPSSEAEAEAVDSPSASEEEPVGAESPSSDAGEVEEPA